MAPQLAQVAYRTAPAIPQLPVPHNIIGSRGELLAHHGLMNKQAAKLLPAPPQKCRQGNTSPLPCTLPDKSNKGAPD